MRLVTRSDFDGLVCGVLLKEAGIIDSYKFAHPKDLQDGIVDVTDNDVLANVPYVPYCGLWFDHHISEQERLSSNIRFKGLSKQAKSCARVIWEYYGGDKTFPERFHPLLEAVDKMDSADLDMEDIINPGDWELLGFIMDPRTGLGRYRDYSISNYQLMEELIEHCRTMDAREILELPDVQERVRRYREHEEPFKQMLQERSVVHGNLIVLDLREQDPIYCGNRFMIYALHPECNISMRIIWGVRRQNVVFTMGKSILNRTSKTHVGRLMLEYGGGGHEGVGTCQVPVQDAERVQAELIDRITSDG
jgi:nanoRNase/pAp phosphatase (c-di-AMP/oligoRNAs hydrolase)